MALGTWIAVIVLGPGSLGVFVWFIFDVRRMFRDRKPWG